MPEVECGLPVGDAAERSAWLIRHGPTVFVRVGFDPGYRTGDGNLPNLPEAEYPALVDTGASLSCIDSELAAQLGLPVVDREPVSGVHGSLEVNVHLAQLYIPALYCVLLGRFHGVHLTQGGQRHLALLGRLFLSDVTMTYDGAGGSATISRS